MNKSTISFRRYALILGMTTLLIYLLFAGLSYQQYQGAREQLLESDMVAAQDEIDAAVRRAVHGLRAGVAELSQWDELYQQIVNRTYFVYWYSHRISNVSGLDNRFSDLMIYDASGQPLGTFEHSGLPAAVDPRQLQETFELVDGDVQVTFLVPLQRPGEDTALGYLGLQAMLMPAIRAQHSFALLDANTLRFASEEPLAGVDSVVGAARFQLLPTRHFALIDDLVRNVIVILGLQVVLPSLLLIVTFTRFVGRSVRRVPEVVKILRGNSEMGPEQIDELLHCDFRGPQIRELKTAERSLLDYHNELSSANGVLDQKNQELWAMAHQDALTGTRNRRAFDDYWQTLQDIGARNEVMPALRVMLFDINRFKAINDSYGHDTGDAVLSGVAECLRRAIRINETLFRLGGDEFACVLQDCDEAQALAVARRCEVEVRRYPFAALGLSEPVRLSIGISSSTEKQAITIKDLLRQADMAMYVSKRPGNQAVTLYRPHMANTSGGIFSTSANEAVYRAVEYGEGLQMHYQPVVGLHNGEVSYYEALLRLEHGGRLIYPDEIMPVVESRHLEMELDQAAIAQVLEDLRSGQVPRHSGVSINIAGASIVDDQVVEWLRPLQAFLDRYKLVIEITETSLITQMEQANRHLVKLRRMGFLVALDDFGSGYSSLRYLTSMPVDIVKFDMALVHALGIPAQRRLVKHLVELISDAGQQLVAEGIETELMRERAKQVGFDCIQGYLVGRPAPLSVQLPLVSATPA